MKPLQRPGRPRFGLSLAAYSLRQFFIHDRGGRRRAAASGGKRIDMPQFLDYCADLGLQGAELTSYYFPPDPSSEYLLNLKRHAFLRGIAISGTAVGNSFTDPEGPKRRNEIEAVKKWIDRAAIMGAPHIRVFAGADRLGDLAESRRLCVEALTECCEYAGRKGIFLGLENHGGIVAESEGVLAIVRAVDSAWFGVNLDTGNFHTEDPYDDLVKCAPYAINVQIKVEMKAKNQARSSADLSRIMKILEQANYQGYVTLEYEAAEDPWQAIPRYLDSLRGAMG